MKKNTTTKSKAVSTGAVVAIGAGVAALAAASYYFFGPQGKKHRESLKGWMIKMKGEIVEKLEASKEVTEQVYHSIVDSVAARFAKSGKVSEAEVRMFAEGLKRHWKSIAGNLKPKRAAKKRSAPRPASKKTVKKSAKKE